MLEALLCLILLPFAIMGVLATVAIIGSIFFGE